MVNKARVMVAINWQAIGNNTVLDRLQLSLDTDHRLLQMVWCRRRSFDTASDQGTKSSI